MRRLGQPGPAAASVFFRRQGGPGWLWFVIAATGDCSDYLWLCDLWDPLHSPLALRTGQYTDGEDPLLHGRPGAHRPRMRLPVILKGNEAAGELLLLIPFFNVDKEREN